MSGGGGGGGSGGGFTPRDRQTPCDQLRFRTTIASPQRAASMLSVGDILEVRLNSGPPQTIDLIDAGGNLVGAIVTRTTDLVRCLQDGFRFEAEVQSINGGEIRIEVRPA